MHARAAFYKTFITDRERESGAFCAFPIKMNACGAHPTNSQQTNSLTLALAQSQKAF